MKSSQNKSPIAKHAMFACKSQGRECNWAAGVVAIFGLISPRSRCVLQTRQGKPKTRHKIRHMIRHMIRHKARQECRVKTLMIVSCCRCKSCMYHFSQLETVYMLQGPCGVPSSSPCPRPRPRPRLVLSCFVDFNHMFTLSSSLSLSESRPLVCS